MDDVIIIKRPRRVAVNALAELSTEDMEVDDVPLFNCILQKAEEGWTEAEAHFMIKQLKAQWHE